jgi:2-polyprenyl-3-methyl-5-hydroxy-6-metoxy-1,4-benzoquinol methylase
MDALNDDTIIASWEGNARPWTTAVRQGRIESRKRVTDRAIVDAILDRSPHTVLDLGCGEGWLVREVAGHGIRGTGIDVVPALVEAARAAGGGDFRALSYEQIAAGALATTADALICNFSLLGQASVEGLFRAAPSLLNPRGHVVVQTLHPLMACGEHPYADGWREGSWAGCGEGFGAPAPWYFRTLASWIALFVDNGFRLVALREPRHPDSGQPASLILIGERPR